MTTRSAVVLTLAAVCFGSLALAQPVESPDPPLVNWTAPPYWTPPAAEQAREHLTGTKASPENHWASPEATATPVPTTILPFTAVTPCRLYDNRASDPPFTGDSTFNTDGQTEQFNFYATSTTPYAANGNPNGCTLPTAGTVGAWSLKFTYRTSSASQGYLTAYPGSLTTRPGIGTILGSSTQQTSGAAIVPAGTDADNTIKVYAQYAANTIVIDYNGYFAAQPVVTGIINGSTTLTGDVTLAQGSNVTITPSGNTLTISTGGAGGTLPAGTAGQTLRSNGSGWLANSFLYNSGSAIGINTSIPAQTLDVNGTMRMPMTTGSTAGVLYLGTDRFLHNYAESGSDGYNVFVGQGAGNFTMAHSANSFEASYNVAVGWQSLSSNTTGFDNTAIGSQSLSSNTWGYANTASGYHSLLSNSDGQYNTASGYNSLLHNDHGTQNTAIGESSLYSNTGGSLNTAIGDGSLYLNDTSDSNTACGTDSLYNTTGSYNIGIGRAGGQDLTTGDYNIDIGNQGNAGEGNTIRIGTAGNHTRTFIAGIRGIITGSTNTAAVLIDINGQLGTVSSSLRFKQDVANMGDASSRLMELRPVTFHYKTQADGPLQYGLIAEEVNEVMPELVVKDATGQPETVAYHELPAMLLNELQKQRATIQAQQAQIEELRAALAERDVALERRLTALEQGRR